LTQPAMLLPHGKMPAALHLVSDCPQLSDQALGLRLPLDREAVSSGLAAVVREAQKVEGLRASLPGGRSVAGLIDPLIFVIQIWHMMSNVILYIDRVS
jgi:hypothetical protein